MEKKHVLIGFALLAGIFVLSCIQTYKIISMTPSSSFENQQMTSLLTGIFKSAVPPTSAPTLSPEVPITPCLPGVEYPLPNGATACFKTLESGQTLNVELCFPTGESILGIPIVACIKIVISRKPSNLPNNPNPYVLRISGGNWWSSSRYLQCTLISGPVLKYSCTSSEWSGARDICLESDGMGGMLVTYCDSKPVPAYLAPYFPIMKPIPPDTKPKLGPFKFPFNISPEMTRPQKPGYIPKEMIPPTSAPPIAPTPTPPQPKKK